MKMSVIIVVMTMTMALMRMVTGDEGQCEEISIPMCKEIGYNYTRLPNQFNHESQDEVIFSSFIINYYSHIFKSNVFGGGIAETW